jgi:hypothetical protein
MSPRGRIHYKGAEEQQFLDCELRIEFEEEFETAN